MARPREEGTPALFEFPPPPGVPLGKRLTLVSDGERRAVFLGPAPIHVLDVADRAAQSARMAMLAHAACPPGQVTTTNGLPGPL